MATKNEIAAQLHEHLCTHNWHGYTQGNGRWGDGEGVCSLVIDGTTYSVEQGDRDCSSSIVECWKSALKGTAYEGKLNGASYTGNMRRVFVDSGLFEWKPMSFIAQRGDIYLNEGHHTAMCQSPNPDMLSEFCINEKGEIVGGLVGDQTGRESLVRPYYNFPWDGILHYNGKADGATSTVEPESKPVTDDYHVYLQAKSPRCVLPKVADNEDDAGDGTTIRYLSAWVNKGQLEVQARNGYGKWLGKLINPSNINDPNTGSVGDGSNITGLRMFYHSPNGDKAIFYRVMVNGAWLPWMKDHKDLGGSSDTFAGNGGNIQRVEAYIGDY